MMKPSLKEKAYQSLKLSILSGEHPVGALLTERALAEKLGMSRTPVRSAIERLESEGYLHCTPNKGILIGDLSLKQVIDFFDLRNALEPYVAGKIAASPVQNDEAVWFTANLEEQESCLGQQDFIHFTELDSAFHRRLFKLYGNQEMIQTMNHLQDKLFRIALNVLKKDNARIHQSILDHRNIWKAIMAGNPELAASELRQHLEYGKKILMS